MRKQKVDAQHMLIENNSSKYWYNKGFNWKAIIVWIVGILLYNLLYFVWTPLGSTIPTFLLIALLYYLVCSKERAEA